VRAAGALLGVAGAVLALRSLVLLLGRGRPRRGPQPPFVVAGPYTRVRNPLFLGLVLALLGVALAIGSRWLLVAAAGAALVAQAWVVRIEEPRLRARFGEAYREYVARVPRWLPRSVGAADEIVIGNRGEQ
jgi:protein-S-isoprenylcysteine O-methyltransferase Ste14